MVFGSRPLGWLTLQVQGLGFASCYHLNLLVVVAKWYFSRVRVLGFIHLQINSNQGIYSTGCSSSVVIFGLLIFFKISILKILFFICYVCVDGLMGRCPRRSEGVGCPKTGSCACLMWVLEPKSISFARVERPNNAEPPLQPLTQIISRMYNI